MLSTPSGAQVEIGLREVDGVITPGTGRRIGRTPVTVVLQPADVSRGSMCNGVPIIVRRPGFRDHLAGLSVGGGCTLRTGRADTVSVTLRRVGSG